MPTLSVVICAHNPREGHLKETLEGLRRQTLPTGQWELLLVDNLSAPPLAGRFDLSWHPDARHLGETELGLTPARRRGISESRADLLVFVDDDNVLDENYLGTTLEIARTYPFLGAWGGQVIPRYEVEPPAEVRPFLFYLLNRQFKEAKWSNTLNFHDTAPCGAGMTLRRAVADAYLNLLKGDPRRRDLGRKGTHLFCCDDTDMALCSRPLGLGMGQFPQLRLFHLIPQGRLQPDFFIKVAYSGAYSFRILDALYGHPAQTEISGLRKLAGYFKSLFFSSSLSRAIQRSEQRGRRDAEKVIAAWPK